MSTVLFSQSNAAGVALLAAYIRLWTETGQVDDLHVVCDPIWTLTDAFWRKTVPWLLGRTDADPPVLRVSHHDGLYQLEPSTLPENPTVVLLRLPRDTKSLVDCEKALGDLVQHFGALNVIEVVDETLPVHDAIDGLRTCRLSDPPLLSLHGRPSQHVLDLAGVAAAALYTPLAYAFPYMRAAHTVVIRMRHNQESVLLELLNRGVASFDEDFPIHEAPTEFIEEGDAILFQVRLTEEARTRLVDPPSSYLEHILQSVLAERHHIRWGIAYMPLEGHLSADLKTVIAARYNADAMRQTLDERLKAHPSASSWRFDSRKRPYYVMSKTDVGEFRRMMTAILPAFFPRLDAALRARGLARRERALVNEALAALEPEATPAERSGSSLGLVGSHEWTVGGELSAEHPAILAAACLLGPSAKEDLLRKLYERRKHLRLCRLWHNLKGEPPDRTRALQWRASCGAEVEQFKAAFRTLWNDVRMPLPQDRFSYAGQERDWSDLATLRESVSREADDAFFEAVKRLYEGPEGRGVGDEFFFSLSELLSWFVRSTPSPENCVVGGFWDPPEGPLSDCVMWWPEVVQSVLRPFWENARHHGGDQGFLRVRMRETDAWLELGLLTSGQGVPSDLLRERLRAQQGLATAAATIGSYGGQVLMRCRDGWFQAGSPAHELVPCIPSRTRDLRVALIDLPALERVVAANPALLHVAADDDPDVVFAPVAPASNPGWEAPCVVVSDNPGGMTAATASAFLETLVGFEVVFRLRRLGDRDAAGRQMRETPRLLGNMCLLVNDDRAQLARWVAELPGFRVVTATDADEAWTRWSADKSHIGLVITDNYMPDENQGVELAARLREDGYAGPIVIATRAPSAVPEEEQERLCLTVTPSSTALRGDRLRTWLRHVPVTTQAGEPMT